MPKRVVEPIIVCLIFNLEVKINESKRERARTTCCTTRKHSN